MISQAYSTISAENGRNSRTGGRMPIEKLLNFLSYGLEALYISGLPSSGWRGQLYEALTLEGWTKKGSSQHERFLLLIPLQKVFAVTKVADS